MSSRLPWKLCPKFLLTKKRISALPLLIKQRYAANNIDKIIVDVNRHRYGALNYANDNLACLPFVEYPTHTDYQDLYKLDTRNITSTNDKGRKDIVKLDSHYGQGMW